jgi:hypothetical protein
MPCVDRFLTLSLVLLVMMMMMSRGAGPYMHTCNYLLQLVLYCMRTLVLSTVNFRARCVSRGKPSQSVDEHLQTDVELAFTLLLGFDKS